MPIMQTEQKCRKCGSLLIERETIKKASQLKKPYYYKAYYYCASCKKIYHNEKFKVFNESKERQNQLFAYTERSPQEEIDVEIWTDGACSFNGYEHAKAAWAFVSLVKSSEKIIEKSGLVIGKKQTNNVAEGLAIHYALSWAAENNYKNIKIYTDSQITIHNMSKTPDKVKQNQEIFQKIADTINKYYLKVYLNKVLGHSGDINNERADKLANSLAGIK